MSLGLGPGCVWGGADLLGGRMSLGLGPGCMCGGADLLGGWTSLGLGAACGGGRGWFGTLTSDFFTAVITGGGITCSASYPARCGGSTPMA